MRELFEDREDKFYKQYAVKSRNSLGRQYPEPPSPSRTCFQRDRDRIIHSKAFRRLKHKTQVFVATESDHYRSRLTHTIEVSHISRHIARLLCVNEDLCETIALAHDLGHTPFGHSGEKELDTLMKQFGGFEHNRQSLRIVDELESKYPKFQGLNLSYEVREGLMKHSTPWDNADVVITYPSIESQIVNIGDEIAYNNHDLDDGIASKILETNELEKNVTLWREARTLVQNEYTDLTLNQLLYLINSQLISELVNDVVAQSDANILRLGIKTLEDVRHCDERIITFSPEMSQKNMELRKYLSANFYSHHTVYQMMKKGRTIIRQLFNAYLNDTHLLPVKYQQKISGPDLKERVICDYIAGMTDNFAEKEYQNII